MNATSVGIDYSATQDAIQLDAWRSVFERIDRILSEQQVRVQIVDQHGGPNDPPGWSNGLDVFLSRPKIMQMLKGKDKMKAVLRLKGLNYHELCHVLYTPRMTDEICRRLIKRVEDTSDQTWWYAFNALEDQRIETWFTSRYGASRRYFEATVLEWIIQNGSAEAAVLLYGRKYLTPKIRVQTGRVFVAKYGQALYDQFKTVIDEYLTYVLPTDSVKAMTAIAEYVDLLKQMKDAHGAPLPILVMMDNGGDTLPGQGQDGVARDGKVFVGPARRARDQAVDDIEDSIDADLDEEEWRDEQDGADQDDEGEGGDGGDSGADAQTDGHSPGNGADQIDGDEDPWGDDGAQDGGNSAGSTGATDNHVGDQPQHDVSKELQDLVDDAYAGMDDVKGDEFVQRDVENVLNAVKAAEQNGRMNAQGKAASAGINSPSAAALIAVRKVHDILARIRQEAEPETLWRQNHGRLDPRRWAQRQSHEVDIFKTWDSGNEEETGVEAVILVDVSGSMSYRLPEASEATWALKRAFDRLDIRTTVLMYDTDHSVLYQPGEKAKPGAVPVLRSGGGTDPTSAIQQAEWILSKSQAPNKVMINVTDGSWGGDDKAQHATMKRLHGLGVVTLLLGLDGAFSAYGKHHHQEGHDLDSIQDLPKVALKIVSRIMRSVVY